MAKNRRRKSKGYSEQNSVVPVDSTPKSLDIKDSEFEGLIEFETLPGSLLKERSQFVGHVHKKKSGFKRKKDVSNKRKGRAGDAHCFEAERLGIADSYGHKVVQSKKRKNKKIKGKKLQLALKKSVVLSDGKKHRFSPDESDGQTKKKKQKRKLEAVDGEPQRKRMCYDKTEYHGIASTPQKADVSSWSNCFVPEPVLRAIAELGFAKPTQIQELCLPAAIKGCRDIIGAAETGSGKTLAFGIPIINGILHLKSNIGNDTDSGMEDDGDVGYDSNAGNVRGDIDSMDGLSTSEDKIAAVRMDGEVDMAKEDAECHQEENSDVEEEDTDDEEMKTPEVDFEENGIDFGCVKVVYNAGVNFDPTLGQNVPSRKSAKGKLYALIITPTRELAVQIKCHIDAVLKYTAVQTAVVFGGVSSDKQERLLQRAPEIVIGTPGRLWELYNLGNPHISQITDIRFLVIDETDRMVEQGHFLELKNILEIINSNSVALQQRQTFVFSATLTLIHSLPKRLAAKHRADKMTAAMKLKRLMALTGIKPKPKIVDITRKFGTAESLLESRIFCQKEEKDFYLYYLLKLYPGRTLVFCNSIDCVRRLQNLFTILQCNPQSLHASLHQKQRLKNLQRFSASPAGLLLASDVAARGLDIPGIQHVIHYQMPRTAETYIHRSGRTARALHEGLSVLLIDPSEKNKYYQVCKTLGRSQDLPSFPTDLAIMQQVRARVKVAQELESKEHKVRKNTVEESWWLKAAKEGDLILDEEISDGINNNKQSVLRNKNDIKILRTKLNQALQAPLLSSDFSWRYPTQEGHLIMPASLGDCGKTQDKNSSAVALIKQERKKSSLLVSHLKTGPPVARVNKKRSKKKLKNKVKDYSGNHKNKSIKEHAT